jgi:hypothetical protein
MSVKKTQIGASLVMKKSLELEPRFTESDSDVVVKRASSTYKHSP